MLKSTLTLVEKSIVLDMEIRKQLQKKLAQQKNLLIVGAGFAGAALVEEIRRYPNLNLYPVAFVDDDPYKLNLTIQGILVVGKIAQIPEIVANLNIQQIIIAMPSVSGQIIREILTICRKTGITTKTLPGLDEILGDHVKLASIRSVKIEDLLRREPISTKNEKVLILLKDKRVLITGAGGSIGSELCRQILKCDLAQIILVGHGENSIFNILQELEQILQVTQAENHKQVKKTVLTPFIAELRNFSRLEHAFQQFRPEIIFHAAAHKHVPLMELNAPEAISNNVMGTKNLLELALKYEVQQLVMVSTDKAVNPTNVMGSSKRVAEMLVLQAAQKNKRKFSVVRFGNVLGSRGSVVPTFKLQIAKGGPITITHPDICRYFMTIPEAVNLVLQAAVLTQCGELFMLDMGKPIKIVDLAKDLIHLSGYKIGEDIDIVFTGLRPGEKLFEELFVEGEEYQPTQNEKILIVKNASKITTKNLDLKIAILIQSAENNNINSIVFLLEQLVENYKSSTSFNNLKNNFLSEKDVISKNELIEALDNFQLQIYYQPIIWLENFEIVGFESLLRWQHPERGLISAREFIGLAEETELIIPIGWWMIKETCRQMKIWQKQFDISSTITVSVNLSKQQFIHPDLCNKLVEIFQETQLLPNCLRLEIPEAIINDESELLFPILLTLKNLGIELQIDYNNLKCFSLKAFQKFLDNQFGSLKVNQELIAHLENNLNSLGPNVIVTKVETAEQVARLRKLKLKYFQGNLFSKPIHGKELMKLIEAQKKIVNNGHIAD
jgi:FlaA1/EpsC-like NDP-sugar epimerase/EAL domain-containing protein (putative c-di-GMP-specific phosphodiesterase class I)